MLPRGHRVDDSILEVSPPGREPREMRFLAWSEVEHLVSCASEPFNRMILVAALTGLRQGELFAPALMVSAGAQPKLLQVQMGHSSIKVTLDRYGHLYPDIIGPVTQALDELIFAPLEAVRRSRRGMRYPLSEVPEAIRYLEEGHAQGKVVITV